MAPVPAAEAFPPYLERGCCLPGQSLEPEVVYTMFNGSHPSRMTAVIVAGLGQLAPPALGFEAPEPGGRDLDGFHLRDSEDEKEGTGAATGCPPV